MKKFVFLFVVIFHCHAFSQSVGIGTTTPNSSAALEIKSTNKGLLIPRVSLISGIDNSTIPSPAPQLIVFNTNSAMTGAPALFYNAGTAASPNWDKLNDLSLPYYNATSAHSTSAFRIENYSGTSNSSAIYGFSQAGTGVFASTVSGVALETNGKVKIAGTGQVPQQGKVLTSDANGIATWEGGVAFSASGIIAGNYNIAPNTYSKIAFATVNYDLGNDYINSTGSPHSTFVAPVNGIYHFDAQLFYFSSEVNNPGIYMNMKRGATESTLASYTCATIDTRAVQLLISRDVQLQAGDQVYILTRHISRS